MLLKMEHLKTTAYHPQCYGAVERLNGTLKQAITKQEVSGVEWVDALPLDLYHLKQVDNASLGMSPHMLVYGGEGRSMLDLVYAGWIEKKYDNLNLTQYATKLANKLSSSCSSWSAKLQESCSHWAFLSHQV